MAQWQFRLDGLQGLTREEKILAEVAIPRTYAAKERSFFLREPDEEACDRVRALLSTGEPVPPGFMRHTPAGWLSLHIPSTF